MDDVMGKIGELLSDKESVKQLSELAQMFMNGSDDENVESAIEPEEDLPESSNDNEEEETEGEFDFGAILKLTQLMGSMNQKDKNSELLLALKPHLKESRQERVDKAIKIMKLIAVWNIVRETGLLKDFL